MALADMYDALTSKRVYKTSWSHQEAYEEIIQKKGTHFDPIVVEAFVMEADEFRRISKELKD